MTGILAASTAVVIGPVRTGLAANSLIVNDITLLNPVSVTRIATPRNTVEVAQLIGASSGPVSIGGGRFSMGGQIAEEKSLHLDMRGCNQLIHFDPVRRIARVQAGMRWRDLQARIDPHDLSVKIMQSYANFTVGGALSVNAHGRYVGLGPLVNSVRRLQLVQADGSVIEASSADNPDLFYGVIGGYGGLGVVTEVELDLVPNVRMERVAARIELDRYQRYFHERILSDPDAILHNADIDPGDFNAAMSITWRRTDRPATVAERLQPVGGSHPLERAEIFSLDNLPGAHLLRRALVDPLTYASRPVIWRNREASLDVASLGPIATADSTHVLQEYFIPIAGFSTFAGQMAAILKSAGVNALNVSIRHAPRDPGTVLAWARQDVFSFVLYYRQNRSAEAQARVGQWTRRLIDAALALGGSHYLPYQLHATRAQFIRAYPGILRFSALKARHDPVNRFRNKLWDKYSA